MIPPKRKRRKKLSEEEIQYLLLKYNDQNIVKQYENELEYDIPAGDKLEAKIENEFKILKGKPLDLYKRFIELTDEYIKTYEKYVPCKKGCGKCCSIPVEIADIERNLIKSFLEKTNNMINYNCFNKPKEPEIFDGLPGYKYTGTKCPFLNKDDECSIYPVRPYMCRRHIIFNDDNSLCDDYDSKDIVRGRHFYSEIVFMKIINYYCAKNNFILRHYDIRDAFEKL